MSTDLRTQIRDFATVYEATLMPVDVEAIIRADREIPVVTPQHRRPIPGWIVAVATAAVVLVLVGGVAWWFNQTSETVEPVATTLPLRPVTTTLPPRPVTTIGSSLVDSVILTPTDQLSGDGWTRRIFPGFIEDGAVWDIAGSDSTLVVVGTEHLPCRLESCRATVLTSTDRGATWLRSPLGKDGDTAWAVTSSESGFVAVGGIDLFPEPPVGLVWTSEDGINWDRHVVVDAFLTGVTDGPDGLMAAGLSDEQTPAEPNDRFVALWTSQNGQEWNKIQTFERGNELHHVKVAAASDGYVVAGIPALESHDLMVWSSRDGITWSAEDTRLGGEWPIVASSGNVTVIGGVGPGQYEWIANGIPKEWHESRGSLQLAHSDDMATWAMTSQFRETCRAATLKDVAGSPNGLLAVGTCDDQVGVWTSATGETWQFISTTDPVFTGAPRAVFTDEGGSVIVGANANVWTTQQVPDDGT